MGNKAATFPLQLLGFDVDVINSVHFSNHTGYPNGFKGEIMNGEQLSTILDGLEQNNLLSNIKHLLTGYIGSVTFLRSVLNVLQTLKRYNPTIRYVCDPVMGDDGKLYVPHDLVSIYRSDVIPLANVVTPNQFEIELLTRIDIQTIDDAIRACQALHRLGPDLVVITSLTLNNHDNGDIDTCQEEKKEIITILASQRVKHKSANNTEFVLWTIDTPKVPGRFTGTGDVTAALFLAWTAKTNDLKVTLEKVASTMYSLISSTAKTSDGTIVSRELKLIKCKNVIENPKLLFHAKKIC